MVDNKIDEFKSFLMVLFHSVKYSYLFLRIEYYFISKPANSDELRKISVAITHFNNPEICHFSLFNLLCDPRVSEIVVLDDCSSNKNFSVLIRRLKPFKKKLKVYRRNKNWGAFPNKLQAVSLCSEEWVLLLDADNTYFKRSMDQLFKIYQWNSNEIYCPGFAYPHFDFRELEELSPLNLEGFSSWMKSESYFAPFLNDGNYFVNRGKFEIRLKPYWKKDVHASDVIFANYLWLSAGGKLTIVRDLWYLHRVHSNSTWLKTKEKSIEVLNPLNELLLAGEVAGDYVMDKKFPDKSLVWEEPVLISL